MLFEFFLVFREDVPYECFFIFFEGGKLVACLVSVESVCSLDESMKKLTIRPCRGGGGITLSSRYNNGGPQGGDVPKRTLKSVRCSLLPFLMSASAGFHKSLGPGVFVMYEHCTTCGLMLRKNKRCLFHRRDLLCWSEVVTLLMPAPEVKYEKKKGSVFPGENKHDSRANLEDSTGGARQAVKTKNGPGVRLSSAHKTCTNTHVSQEQKEHISSDPQEGKISSTYKKSRKTPPPTGAAPATKNNQKSIDRRNSSCLCIKSPQIYQKSRVTTLARSLRPSKQPSS